MPDVHASYLLPAADVAPEAIHPVRACIIDLGTNSFHTIIVDAYPNGTFTVVDRLKEMVQLGEGGFAAGRLTEAAMARGLEALHRVRLLAEGHRVEAYLAYATSAIREAENGGDFIRAVQQATGIHIQPIDGRTEAHLIYLGVRRAVDLPRPALLVDIGGGSTECIIGDAHRDVYAVSYKIGAARMTERFVTTDPVERREFKALRAHYRAVLAPVYEQARAHGIREIVGSSGTMENLARVYVEWFGDTSRAIEQQVFEGRRFREVTKRLMRSTRAEREAMESIDAKRVDQIVAGAILVDVLIKDLEIEQIRLSPYALREGMVVQFIEENTKRLQRIAPFHSVRRRSVYDLGFRFRWDAAHARQVTALALQLFDACRPLHHLGPTEREWLEYAALLHDIGYHVSHRKHHKHSRYLIEHAELPGFQPEEIAIIANVARYHRRAFPKKKHRAFRALSREHRRIVRQLASFLRLAEGLDRSHLQHVTGLFTQLGEGTLRLIVEARGEPHLDVWGADRSRALFEQTFGLTVQVEARAPAAFEPPPPAT
ncbi:MAG: Ppx/GppA family phosphatase [Bacteroidetes bacterium]|nr:MAG: Ppx/GppA family phosphatase [Bacteroidota bacterium]